MTANSIGLVIKGIAVFATLAFTVYKNWEPIKTFFVEFWEELKKGFGLFKEVGSLFNSVFGNSKPAQTVAQSKLQSPKIVNSRLTSQRNQLIQQNSPVQITVNPSPDMDEMVLAGMVRQQLEQSQRDQQSRSRAFLFDTP